MFYFPDGSLSVNGTHVEAGANLVAEQRSCVSIRLGKYRSNEWRKATVTSINESSQ